MGGIGPERRASKELWLLHAPYNMTADSKVILHEDGTVSVRLNGSWTRQVTELSRKVFMSLRSEDREKLWYEGIKRGRDFVAVKQVGGVVWP